MTVSQDPFRRLLKFSKLGSPVTIDGTTYGYALYGDPRGETKSIVSGTVAGGTAVAEAEGFATWDLHFERAVQRSHYTKTYMPGDSTEVQTSHLMGGNIVTTPEWMRLHRYNSSSRIAGGDFATRIRPGDLLEFDWPPGSKKLRGEVIDVTPHGTAPSEVNYNPATPVSYVQTSQQADRQVRLAEYVNDGKRGELYLFDVDSAPVKWQSYLTLVKTGTTSSGAVNTDMTRVKFRADTDAAVTAPYTLAEEGYFPNAAQFPDSLTFFFDESSWVFTFGHALSDEDVASFYHNFFRYVVTEGESYLYEFNDRVAENTSTGIYLPLLLEGAGGGLDLPSAGVSDVAVALEPWGEPFDAQIKVEAAEGASFGLGDCGIVMTGTVGMADEFFIAIDFKGGGSTCEVWEVKQTAGDTLKASFSPSYPFEIRVQRTAGTDTFAVSWRQSVGAWTALTTITGMAVGDKPKIGPYASMNSRVKWSQVAPGPTKKYYLHRPGLFGDEIAYFGMVDGIVAAPLNNAPVVFELVAEEDIDTVVNQTANDTSMSDVATPKARDEYSFDAVDNTVTIPLPAAGDEVVVTLDAPESVPDPPGDYPPDQGVANFSTDGGTVSQNRANYYDLARVRFKAEANIPSALEWEGVTFDGKRNPMFNEVTSLQVDESAETEGTWTTVPTSKWLGLPFDRVILIKKDWVEANFDQTDELAWRLTANEWQMSGAFDANAYNKAIEVFESLDNGWFYGGTGGSTAPEFTISASKLRIPGTYRTTAGGLVVADTFVIGNTSQTFWLNHPELNPAGSDLVGPDPCDPPNLTGNAYGWTTSIYPVKLSDGTEQWRGWVGADGDPRGLISAGSGDVCAWYSLGIDGGYLWTMTPSATGLYNVSGTDGYPTGGTPGGEYIAQINASGISIGLSDKLSRWPDDTEILEAYAEVSVPAAVNVREMSGRRREARVSDLSSSPNKSGYEITINGTRYAFYEQWNGSSWATVENITGPVIGYDNTRSFDMGFALMGTRRSTRRLRCPDISPQDFATGLDSAIYTALGGSLVTTYANDQKSFIVDFTGIVQALFDDRQSLNAADGYFLWPTVVNTPEFANAQSMGQLLNSIFPTTTIERLSSTVDPGGTYYDEQFDNAFDLQFTQKPTITKIMVKARLPGGLVRDLRVPAKRPNLIVLDE